MALTYSLVYGSTNIQRSDGWTIMADPDNTDYQSYLAWVVAGNTPTPATTPAVTEAQMLAAVQTQLDTVAQSYGYDNILSACTYAAQATGAPFQAEGAAFVAWRTSVWSAAYALLAQIQAGTASMPTTVAAAIALMPAYVPPTSGTANATSSNSSNTSGTSGSST